MKNQNQNSRTGGQHSFAQIPSVSTPRSTFNRSCGIKTTFDAGFLIPFFCDEALPGDTFNLNTSLFARLATPLHPYMDNLYVDTHFFAVPIRLIWDNFRKMMGEQDDPGDSIDFLVPTITGTPIETGFLEGSLADYLGVPTKIGNISTSALWHRAYNLIWREWFRDENLQDSPLLDRGDAVDDDADYPIRRRGKRHDYFSSCLPWPQKGAAVTVPLAGTAPLTIIGTGTPQVSAGGGATSDIVITSNILGAVTNPGAMSWEDPGLGGTADLGAAAQTTINQLRESFQIQKLMERDARGGTRYTEILRSHFGVVSPDSRLQRPEYLGGSSTPIHIQPVAATTAGIQPLGELAGFGTAASQSGHGFNKSFTEHCVILGLVSVRGDLNYQQGLPRPFSRRGRYDFYWPSLAHLGEQAVFNKEIYMQGIAADDAAFGYQERFAEYRYKPSTVTGKMRSNATASLDTWHLAQDFSSLPVLDSTFIEETPPVARIVATPAEPDIILDAYFSFKCARPMPMYGVPGNIDRF